jgi:hypothetical protein
MNEVGASAGKPQERVKVSDFTVRDFGQEQTDSPNAKRTWSTGFLVMVRGGVPETIRYKEVVAV